MSEQREDIFTVLRNYEHDFLNKPVRIVDGYDFSQHETIRRAHLYQNNHFENGNTDEYGDKIFFQIIRPRVKNSVKNTDLDIKDINIRAVNGKDYMKAWIYRRSAQNWMRERKFGQFLNELPNDAFSFGTVVAKKVPGEQLVEWVDLRNLMNDPSTKRLKDSWVIEDHYYTPTELRAFSGIWENVDEAIKNFKTNRKQDYVSNTRSNTQDSYGDAQYIRVREFYGHVPQNWVDDSEDENYALANFIVIMPDASSDSQEGLILKKALFKETPYKEVHMERAKGRWLGVGLYEELGDAQMFKNEEINQIRMALRLAALILFQTNDKTVAKNILKDLQNGDILKFAQNAQGLTRVDTRILDNATNNLVSQEIEKLANDLANSFEVTTGANMPSGTPYSLGALLNQNATKLFDFIRENFGLFIQEIFEDWVLPELEKDMTKGHILEITDLEEVKMLHEAAAKHSVWDAIKRYILSKGKPPTVLEIEVAQQFIMAQLETRQSVFLDIANGFLKMDKKIEVVVTDERQSEAQRQTKSMFMQMLKQDPTLIENKAFMGVMDDYGFSVADFPMPAPKAQQLSVPSLNQQQMMVEPIGEGMKKQPQPIMAQ